MKKLLFIAVLALLGMTAQAQTEKGDMAAGLNLGMGMGDGFTNIGIGAKYQWTIVNNLRLESAFNYYLKKDFISMWDLGINAHYLFSLSDKFVIYPLAGLGVLGVKASYDLGEWGGSASASDTNFAINLGAGAEYLISPAISLGLEFKYKIASNWNRALFSIGAAYHF